eukprot:TRINITY_DN17582_c0_g1_i1.p1 TRINITY_DN17582_c0_g1~~TRINITY_DN17582_c0_g1_i1.p1  ORF type:complete len:232 (-),score=58.64 TRINITY_DN17582_c0_g1_i1:257-952(-)
MLRSLVGSEMCIRDSHSMGLSSTEEMVLQVVATSTSTLSFVGSTLIVLHLARKQHATWNEKMVMILSMLDMVASSSFGIGRGLLQTGVACDIQGFMIQWFGLATAFWTTFMSVNLYAWVCLRKSEDQLESYKWRYLLVALGLPLVGAIVAACTGSLGDTTLWCWIPEIGYQIGLFYGWVLVCWVCTIAVSLLVAGQIKKRRSLVDQGVADMSSTRADRELIDRLRLSVIFH